MAAAATAAAALIGVACGQPHLLRRRLCWGARLASLLQAQQGQQQLVVWLLVGSWVQLLGATAALAGAWPLRPTWWGRASHHLLRLLQGGLLLLQGDLGGQHRPGLMGRSSSGRPGAGGGWGPGAPAWVSCQCGCRNHHMHVGFLIVVPQRPAAWTACCGGQQQEMPVGCRLSLSLTGRAAACVLPSGLACHTSSSVSSWWPSRT